ncbi:MAG: vitamin K epoxide reductase family protein [bacterium]|nr:vitamin K epoxide reductase family protein [bacterium]
MPGYLITIIILAVIGMLNTTYLVIKKMKREPVFCLFFPQEWCDIVNDSKYSKTLGFPNSLAGFYIYSAILVFTLFFYYGVVSFTPVLILAIIGFYFSMYFLFIQAFVLKAYCTWCVLSAIEFTLLLIIVLFFR